MSVSYLPLSLGAGYDLNNGRPLILPQSESAEFQEILLSQKRDMDSPTSMPRHRQPRTVPHQLTGILLTNGSPLLKRQRERRRQEILDGQTGAETSLGEMRKYLSGRGEGVFLSVPIRENAAGGLRRRVNCSVDIEL